MRKRIVAFFLCVIIVLMGAVSAYADGSNFAIATVSNAYRSAVRTGSDAAHDYEKYGVESPSNTKSVCEYCGAVSGEEHSADCLTRCTCGMPDGVHLKGCVLYVEGTCTCNTETLFHDSKCALYVAPETAVVYTEESGVYSAMESHGVNHPIDMKKYDGKIIYVLESEIPQQIYFTREVLGGLGGAYFSLSESEYVKLDLDGAFLGNSRATVTLAAETPAGTEIELKANKLIGHDYFTVKIVVLDEIPKMEGTEIVYGDVRFSSDVNISIAETNIDKQDAIVSEMGLFNDNEEEQKLYYFDIDSESATATFSVNGLVDSSEGCNVIVLHLLDDADAIAAKIEEQTNIDYFVVNDSSLFEKEITAAQAAVFDLAENRVYYTYQSASVDKDGTITIAADSFSTFIFVVNFEYNGHKVSLSGLDSVYLSELLTGFDVEWGLDDIADVSFSDESLIKVTKDGKDWLLTSLHNFGTTEWLTIELEDGTSVDIRVTDPTIFNYTTGFWNNDATHTTETLDSKINVISGCVIKPNHKYKVNSTVIDNEDVVAKTTAIVIYAEPGMAIRFEAGTNWDSTTSRPTDTSGFWTWAWDGKINYMVLNENATDQITVPVKTNVKSDHVCNVTVIIPEKGNPELLEVALSKSELNDDYSLKALPVTLYNYDGLKFNQYYDKKTDPYFSFASTSQGQSSTAGLAHRTWTKQNLEVNGGGGYALQGIMETRLDSETKLPVTAGGQKVDLFSRDTLDGAKKVYENVGFQFVYNESSGYYTYSSNLNHAQLTTDDDGNQEVKLYRQSMAPADSASESSHGNAGFYPFEDINDAALNSAGSSMSWDEWADALDNDFELKPAEYARDIVSTGSTNPASVVDMHFGLKLEADFYLPENKRSDFDSDDDGTNDELVYEFTGDDDLWVYVDDQLVLDIGGGHTYVSGSINFTTGEVWVEKYTKMTFSDHDNDGIKETITSDGPHVNKPLGDTDATIEHFTIDGDKMHTLRVFYLERHSGVSNCRMHFNIPVVPSNSVIVKKDLVNHEGLDFSVTPDVDYTFKVYTKKPGESEFSVLKNTDYAVGGSTETTDAIDGTFKLKSGQSAVFNGIDRFTEVYAVEQKPDDGYEYTEKGKVSVNNAAVKEYVYNEETDCKEMQANSNIIFAFTNYMYTQPLTFEKEVIGGTDGLINPDQSFEFMLNFTKDIIENGENEIEAKAQKYVTDTSANEMHLTEVDVNVTDAGTFNLKHGESITIPRVPVNMTYDFGEKNPDMEKRSFDDPIYKQTFGDNLAVTRETTKKFVTDYDPNDTDEYNNYVIQGTIEQPAVDKAEKVNHITVVNQQRFDLKLIKKVTGVTDPDQSFLFEINGVEGTHTAGISAEVVVPAAKFQNGEAVITIADLPVGEYTVKEDTNWSWRYTIDSNTSDSQVNLETVTATVNAANHGSQSTTFTNKRTTTEWLDGSSWCKNLFDGKTSTETENATNSHSSLSKMSAFKREDNENIVL